MILSLLPFITLAACMTYIGRQVNGTDVFTGIPYAQPPLGSLRLQKPASIANNMSVVNASGLISNRCFGLTVGEFSLAGISEDCLTLDIVCPSQTVMVSGRQKKLPVYVFIHGGNFNDGDKSECNGGSLVRTSIKLGAPIIYVAVNYRLSFLGFPTGDQLSGSYNLGLLDQRLALQWVQDEIEYFGGDPRKVVIGGHSAGANSIAYQMMAYQTTQNHTSNDLFRGIILESGSATALTAIQHRDNESWQRSYENIADAVGCNSTSPLQCFQNVPITALRNAYTTGFSNSGFASPISLFSPVPDESFMIPWLSSLSNSGAYSNVPAIIGTTTDELVQRIPIYDGLSTDTDIIRVLESFHPSVPSSSLQDLLSYYPAQNFPNIGPPLSGAQWSRAVAAENDLQVVCPAYTQAVLQAAGMSSIWKFRWNAVLQSMSLPQWDGVPQGSELYYTFPYVGENIPQSSADLTLMLSFQRHIIGFINSLNPNSLLALETTPSVHWPRFDDKTHRRLVYQRAGGSAKGLFTEEDNINLASCNFINSQQPIFL